MNSIASQIRISSLAFFCLLCTSLLGQEEISLPAVWDKVMEKSSVVALAKNQYQQAEAGFRFFQSQLKPGLSLRASLPNYSKTSSPIIQPDGTIAFTSIRQANSSLSLTLGQIIPQTGGQVFLYSDLQRFDDLSSSFSQYNGVPIRLGLIQPLFGFNPWKYDRQMVPLRLVEAERGLDLEAERAKSLATGLYFDVLVAQQNLDIALSNESVNTKLLGITEERLTLGKVSEDEKLQLEIELNNARLGVSQARIQLRQAEAALFTFLGDTTVPAKLTYTIPTLPALDNLNPGDLVEAARRHRPEYVAYQQDVLAAERQQAQARADFGFRAELFASIGLARGSEQLEPIYNDPFDEQQFNIGITVPIVDWGRRKAALEQARLQGENARIGFQQWELELENTIHQQVGLLASIQGELQLLADNVSKAEQRFSISNERYTLGNIDITNLTIAQREKDQAKRNFINAQRMFWATYFNLRQLTGQKLN